MDQVLEVAEESLAFRRIVFDGRRLEKRQADERTLEAGRLCFDDAIAVYGQSDECELRTAGGISEQLHHTITVATP